MKRLACILVFLLIVADCHAQIPELIKERFRLIVDLVKDGDADELSKLINYPLRRANPLPNILNKKEFVAYFDTVFEKQFKKKLLSYHDSVILDDHTGRYGLVGGSFSGEIWIDMQGKVTWIMTMSRKEIALQNRITKSIQREIYPAINAWEWNIMVGRAGKLLGRVDWPKQGLRLASWAKGQTISAKPDMILKNGAEQAQGTIGGWTYTFKNGAHTYVVNDVQNCEQDSKGCGYFLEVYLNEKLQNSTRLLAVKK